MLFLMKTNPVLLSQRRVRNTGRQIVENCGLRSVFYIFRNIHKKNIPQFTIFVCVQ